MTTGTKAVAKRNQFGFNETVIPGYQRIPSLRREFQRFHPCNPWPATGPDQKGEEFRKEFRQFMKAANSAGAIRGLTLEGFNEWKAVDNEPSLTLERFAEAVEQRLFEESAYDPAQDPSNPGLEGRTETVYFPTRGFLERFYEG
ncbi:MAG: hypothetical protein KJ600_01900 [Nanoarchaeota archaeon]|nr:hypothetical protein [Nanoarchaeota archaeon]MBU1103289.1 hypothetical protein [Nanoarchaeota archaeon]